MTSPRFHITDIVMVSIIIFYLGIIYLIIDLMLTSKKNNQKKLVRLLVILILVFITIAIIIPTFIIISSPRLDEFNEIGDAMGGIMNPFIAIAGVLTTGLAFYAQYSANKNQIKLFKKQQTIDFNLFREQVKLSKSQFNRQLSDQNEQNKIQRFEDQFYEMLELHRANIEEMEIEGYSFETNHTIERTAMDLLIKGPLDLIKNEKTTSGRKVFVTMKTELECLYEIWLLDDSNILDDASIKMLYELFFNGFDWFQKKYITDRKTLIPHSNLLVFESHLIKARNKHKNELCLSNWKYYEKIQLNFNYKPFSGHSSRLAHYFRHLFLTVKFVVNEADKFLDYEAKMKYLKLLRAQFSNFEQIFLFYNWLGGYGAKWEDKNNNFFSDYCMIHNLWYDSLFQYEIKEGYINRKIEELRKIKPKYRDPKESLFEMDSY